MVYRTSVRLRAACMGIIYRKILELKNLPQAGSANDIINIITSDVARIFDAIRQCVLVIGGPLLMIAGAAYSVYLLSWIALVGASILILFYPLQVQIRSLAKTPTRSFVRVAHAPGRSYRQRAPLEIDFDCRAPDSSLSQAAFSE